MVVFGATGLLLLFLAEGVTRLFGARFGVDVDEIGRLRTFLTEENAGPYVPRAYYGFARNPATGAGNRWGFLGEDWAIERAPKTWRIACLGGSTTESGNPAGHEGSYPHLLEDALRARTDDRVEVMNCGISLWSSNESVCAWFVLLRDFRPDLVIFHHSANDVWPRDYPGYRSDFAHYRRVWRRPDYGLLGNLAVRASDLVAWYVVEKHPPELEALVNHPEPSEGVHYATGALAPETLHAYERNILSIAADLRRQGGEMMLMTMPTRPRRGAVARLDEPKWDEGIHEQNELMRRLAAEHGFLLADAVEMFGGLVRLSEHLFRDLVHLEAEGNRWKADLVADVICRWSTGSRERLGAAPVRRESELSPGGQGSGGD